MAARSAYLLKGQSYDAASGENTDAVFLAKAAGLRYLSVYESTDGLENVALYQRSWGRIFCWLAVLLNPGERVMSDQQRQLIQPTSSK